jgi:hypothetical protein
MVAEVGQLPAPSQPARAVKVLLEQLAARQVTSPLGYVQAVAEAEVQDPAQAPFPAHGARRPCGGPEVTCVQVPVDVPLSQALHASVQA